MMTIHQIPIKIFTRERRKTLCLRIATNGDISLKVPTHVNDAEIEDFVLKKKSWILKKIAHFAKFEDVQKSSVEHGQKTMYLGKKYQIDIQKNEANERIVLEQDDLIIYSNKPENIRHNERLLERWYLTQAERIFHERLSHALSFFPELTRPVLKIRKYKSRWGSYASNHVMTLNSILIKAEVEAIDYVIYHELCHYYNKSHNQDFYALVESKMPHWKEVRKRLNDGHLGV